jgi:hypothetical protein
MYYTVYKITNIKNGNIYVGVHRTTDLNDAYMGSGGQIKKAIKLYGLANFKKEYIAIFDNAEEMFNMESEIVNVHFTKRKDTYNVCPGGVKGFCKVKKEVTVRDIHGATFRVATDDSRYLSGELVSIQLGYTMAKDATGKLYRIKKDDPRYLSGELTYVFADTVVVRDASGRVFVVSHNDLRYLSGELVVLATGFATVKDKNGNKFRVSIDDPRYLSGELVGHTKGSTHTTETKNKISTANKIKSAGEGNSQYGKMWIHNLQLKQNKSIKKETFELWVNEGWLQGRKMKFQI